MALSKVRKVVSCKMAKWGDRDTKKPDELRSDQFYCFECGNVISKGDSTCAKCGWSWQDSNVQQGTPADG